MFDIKTSQDFLKKLEADYEDFAQKQDSARLALNCAITAYHIHEWVWGDWLETDYSTWKAIGISDYKTFLGWLDQNCAGFKVVQDMANGTKHFIRTNAAQTSRVSGYGVGPYGVGPYGAPYLLIDHGKTTSGMQFQTASELLKNVIDFWGEFFRKYRP